VKEIKIALAGNPNVGKSTVFNALTGLHQHTGNWPGKTVELKSGNFSYEEYDITLVDVPGTYSMEAHSVEEEVTRDYISSGDSSAVVVVCDGCLLERNLILVLQVMEICSNVIVCVNLMDEAEKKGIEVDTRRLSKILNCPVIPCAARQNVGLDELKRAMIQCIDKDSEAEAINEWQCCEKGCAGKCCCGCDGVSQCGVKECGRGAAHDRGISAIDLHGLSKAEAAEKIAAECVTFKGDPMERDRFLDRIFTGKYTAYPVMGLLLVLVFYITICGAGYFSDAISFVLGKVNVWIFGMLSPIMPSWLTSLLCDGLIGTTFTVISVMFPPMAIFFPLFTLLEDSGYLPRAAYNIDRCFKCCGSCGKQSLTMMMGFGCNAAGVTGCRIIDSPRERLIAIITNSLVPCNGRFPIILSLIAILAANTYMGGSIFSALVMALIIVACTAITLAVSKLLSITLLKGEPSSFTLELPPYRRPRILCLYLCEPFVLPLRRG